MAGPIKESNVVKQETVFSVDTSTIKFGPGSIAEVGEDLNILGVRRAMWLCDPNLVGTDGQQRLCSAPRGRGHRI